MNKRRIVGFAVFVLAVSACIGPSLDELVQAADDLAIPTDWELLEEETTGRPCTDPVENCPNVDRIYRVPIGTPFGLVSQQIFENAKFTLWYPAAERCTPIPEQGCSVRARLDDVSARTQVKEVGVDSYIVLIRVGQYVGP